MNDTRQAILGRLAASRTPVSGDLLAAELGISRTAIWKHVQGLRGDGLDIDALGGQGYLLRSDVLVAGLIRERFGATQPARIGRMIEVVDEIDSTNRELLRRAEQGTPEGLALFAERQTEGRGRLARRWHTFAGSALAFSLLLRPALPPQRIPEIPLVAACGLYRAMAGFAPEVRLKWPNDLLHHGKKLAGILTEMRAEPGRVHALVIGIGLNVKAPAGGWPADITQPVTDLTTAAGHALDRHDIAAACIRGLDEAYQQWLSEGFAPIRDAWWQAHAASGQKVRVHDGTGYIEGLAEALDLDGALLLRTGSETRRIIAGDLELLA